MWSFFSRDSAKDFPYEIGEAVHGLEQRSIWSLHQAHRKNAGPISSGGGGSSGSSGSGCDPAAEVSVFVYDIKSGSDTKLEIAKAAVKKLKTLRHPSVLQYLDSVETDKVLYVATERVEPLGTYAAGMEMEAAQKDLYLAWGIFQITRALSFLNNDGNLRHNNVSCWSVFVNACGEWKLGGLEYVSPIDGNPVPPLKVPPVLELYDPPERADASKAKAITKCSTDMWGLGCLVWETYNGPLRNRLSLKELNNIPKSVTPLYCELVGANPATRPNPADVITRCRKPDGFFKNDLVDTLLFLEEIQIKDKAEKLRFFNAMTAQLDNFPPHVCKEKILPQLITSYEYGDAGSAILPPMFKLGNLLDEAEYQKRIVPCVVKLFASTDRVTRARLLTTLVHFVGHLQPQVVNDQIFPNVALGFLDTNPYIRDQTIESIIHLAPKLNYNNLNVEVLRHFARMQAKDEQGGIRTNTTVCLGNIAKHLHPQVRQRVLVSAFMRAIKDTFAPARGAGVLALATTQQYFLLSEVAHRILPALCTLTVDPDKTVREHTFKTLRGFLGKLERVSEDPSLRERMEADVHTATPSLGNAAATWAGWAVTAVTAKFYRSQSDSSKPPTRISVAGKALSKPASLEHPSNSSISTTTSSVTSMTSLEHESNETSVSASDYGNENWDNENWGEMDVSTSQDPSSPVGAEATNSANVAALTPGAGGGIADSRDGWDNEEWGSLEEEPNEESEEKTIENEPNITATMSPPMRPNAGRTSTSGAHGVPPLKPNVNHGRPAATSSTSSTATSLQQSSNSSSNSPRHVIGNHVGSGVAAAASAGMSSATTASNSNWNCDSWADGEFEPLEEDTFAAGSGNAKLDEARRKREEKKQQRQRELEQRRAARGPLKLGAKKI